MRKQKKDIETIPKAFGFSLSYLKKVKMQNTLDKMIKKHL